jgi:hypothetical protein
MLRAIIITGFCLLLVPSSGKADQATATQIRLLQSRIHQLRVQEKADLKQVDAKYQKLLTKGDPAENQLSKEAQNIRQSEQLGEKNLQVNDNTTIRHLGAEARQIRRQQKLLAIEEMAALNKYKTEHEAQAAQAEAKLKGLRRQLHVLEEQKMTAANEAKDRDARKKVESQFEAQIATQKKQIQAQLVAMQQMKSQRRAGRLALEASYDSKRKQLGQKYRADQAAEKVVNAQSKAQEKQLEATDNFKLQEIRNQRASDETTLKHQHKAERQQVIANYEAQIKLLKQQLQALKGASGGKSSKGHKLTRTNHRGY